MKILGRPRGAALIIGFAMIVMLTALTLAFSSRMTSTQLRMESDIAGVRSYELAQTWNALKIQEVWKGFKEKPINQRVAWLGGEDANNNGRLDDGEDANSNGRLDPAAALNYQDSGWVAHNPGDTCTRIKVLYVYKRDWALIRFTTWGRGADEMSGRTVVRKIQRVVRFELGPASAFDYAYFANNHASISGDKLSIFGSVGANGNVELSGNPLIDGNIFASANPDLGALGTVTGTARRDSLENYRAKARTDPNARPTNPTAPPEDLNGNGKLDPGEDSNSNGKLDNFAFQLGYDGAPKTLTMQNQEVMPDFGNLDYYRGLAAAYVRPAHPEYGDSGGTGGIVKQLSKPGLDPTNPANYETLIDQTYGFAGELGFESLEVAGAIVLKNFAKKLVLLTGNTLQNGNVALIGTAAQPIIISGPVVISSDLVIKGIIAGQGTFYTGRNTHVVGDLMYKNPPQWKQNDTHFAETAARNKTMDMVGFGVAGNVVFGDYTDADTNGDQWNSVMAMLKPPYTHPQKLPFNLLDLVFGLLDILNGYDNGFGIFNGDYTRTDGGRIFNDDGSIPLFANRKFFQSSFPKAYIHSIADTPHEVHGIFYTAHFFGGRLNNLQLYGAMIARDEAIVTNDGGSFFYDPRLSKRDPMTYVNLFLPRNAALDVIQTKELGSDDASPASADW